MTDSAHNPTSPALVKILGMAFYGVAKSNAPDQSTPMERISLCMPDVACVHDTLIMFGSCVHCIRLLTHIPPSSPYFKDITCGPAGSPTAPMPTYLLIYNRDDEPNTPPPSNADILNDLVHHIPGVHWRHAAKMGRKIDRERVLRALETYLSAPHTPGQ